MQRKEAICTASYRIYYEDTDAGGIVYHANYLRYMERVRSDWLRQLGFDQSHLLLKGVQFVVHSIGLQYLKPARLDDCILVTLNRPKLNACSMEFQQGIFLAQEPIVVASVKIVCTSATTQRVMKMPDEVRQSLVSWQRKADNKRSSVHS